MRSFSALMVFETAFDNMVSADPILSSMQQQVFSPVYNVVEDSCGTYLGETLDVNFEAEGRVELATDMRLSRRRIVQLLEQGEYTVRTRSLSTCISHGGVCAACYNASRPTEQYPYLNEPVTVLPIFDKGSEVVGPVVQNGEYLLTLDPNDYDTVTLFANGNVVSEYDYTISGRVLTILANIGAGIEGGGGSCSGGVYDPDYCGFDPYVVVRYQSLTRVPYMLWLAGTYSGSLLGIRPLPGPLLSVRTLLLTDSLKDSPIDTLLADTKKIQAIPANMLEYASGLKDVLEQTLFLIALRAIYDSVSS